MKIYRYFVLVVAFLAALATISGGANAEENVYVTSEYLTNSDGYDYGANYFLSSTVNDTVAVYPYVVSQENVIGSVTPGPVLLKPNESNFSIGQFISADRSKAWSVDVGAKWQRWK
jgi:hypothetical protein